MQTDKNFLSFPQLTHHPPASISAYSVFSLGKKKSWPDPT